MWGHPCLAAEGHQRPKEAAGPDFINRWVEIAADARRHTLRCFADAPFEVQRRACEQAAILVSLNNLRSFPWVKSREDEGTLTVHGWYFDLQAGALHAYSPRLDSFLPLVCPLPGTISA
ncbi:carbonic anhydrase [Parachitinimonas caeni]|uniref:carbonic anhydrase n=1 Tax=Parachitinimonas caeni TaxID=3031301 RepID=UPI0027E47EC5|nr:carbonic anhydrase [Parachitinimonas caeni]